MTSVHACLVGIKTRKEDVHSNKTILMQTSVARNVMDNSSSSTIRVTSNVNRAILDVYYVMVLVTVLAQVIFVEVRLGLFRNPTQAKPPSNVHALTDSTLM